MHAPEAGGIPPGYKRTAQCYLKPGQPANPLQPCFLSLQSVFLQGMFADSVPDVLLLFCFFFVFFLANDYILTLEMIDQRLDLFIG